MADFETCYFCGAGPSDAVEEVGVVPAAFDPAPDQQQSVVLCPDCRDKLTAVMEAAVEAAGDGAGGGGSDRRAAGGQEDAGEQAAHGGSRRSSGAGGYGDAAGGDSGTDAETLADVGGVSSGGVGGAQGDDVDGGRSTTDAEPSQDAGASTDDSDGTARGAETSGETREAGPVSDDEAADDGVTLRDEDDEEGIRHTRGEGVSFGTATAGDEDVEGGEGDDDEAPPQRETGAASVESSGGDVMDRGSAAYRQVIRLLQNREFPVERDEIAAVAASAYELSPGETEDAIDAILQKGLLVEEDGVLRKP